MLEPAKQEELKKTEKGATENGAEEKSGIYFLSNF